MSFDQFKSKTVIALTTFNRKKMTELCIQNLVETSQGVSIWIYDDHSTQYDLDWLKALAPQAQVIRQPGKLGVERLRVQIQRDAEKSAFQYIYHTDNDTIHDPAWLNELYRIFQLHPGWIGLYNAILHSYGRQKKDEFALGGTCPGVSFFYPIQTLAAYDLEKPRSLSWDYDFGNYLKTCAISEMSWVEHFGAGGLHNSNFEQDRAIRPTDWLKNKRPEIISKLQG